MSVSQSYQPIKHNFNVNNNELSNSKTENDNKSTRSSFYLSVIDSLTGLSSIPMENLIRSGISPIIFNSVRTLETESSDFNNKNINNGVLLKLHPPLSKKKINN